MLTFDLWVPATMAPDLFAGSRELEDRGQRGYNVAGRLAPTATRKMAQTELEIAMGQLAHDFPDSNRTMTGEVRAFWQAPRGPQQFFIGALALLQGVLLLLLLAVCGNTANLMLARASARYREIGVRLALGATAQCVVAQIVGDTLRVVGAGALVGWTLMFVVALHLLGGVISLPIFVGVPAILLARRRPCQLVACTARHLCGRDGGAAAGVKTGEA
jgi:hypothetical protein